jgi:3-hydroxyanthranilate 3,4-dioxygenase
MSIASLRQPFNFARWIDAHSHLLRPPVGNKMVFEDAGMVVMVVGGPNQRVDFHDDPGEEFFYQLRGDIVLKVAEAGRIYDVPIREGEVFLLPPHLRHSPQRPIEGSVGLVVESPRGPGDKDGFEWFCFECGALVHRVEIAAADLVKDLPPLFAAFYADESARKCRACGSVHPGKEPPPGWAAFRREERAMKFGIFYELQLPRPWTPEGEFTLYQNALDQVELADRLGYDFAWEVEHHFLEEYSHSPAPEVFLAAASQRTKQIRLAHGIMQLTTVHPARVAERIAALDLVSRGRVEFGMGESASITELEPFERDFGEKRAVWEDAVRAVIPMFNEGGCEYHGTHFDFPLRNVVPKPLQKPHPPLWVACSQLDTIEMAGRRGLGALAFQFLSADAAHAWVHAYYNSFTKRLDKLADYITNPNIALTSYFMCAETDEEARRRADGIPFFQFALRFYGLSPNRKRPEPGTVNLWDEYEKWKRENPEGLARALSGGLIGSPETLRRRLRRFETSHIDQVILLNQAGKNTHEHICESLELFAHEVMPEFHAHEPAQQAWKRQVLAREIELEEIDTDPFRERYGPNSVQIRPAAE